MGNEHGTNQRWVLGLMAATAWVLALVAAIGGAGDPAAFLVFVGWVFNATYVGLDSHSKGMPAFFWTLLAVFTGPVATLVYVAVRPPAPAVCPGCGSVLNSSNEDCPSCGHRPVLSQAMSVANQVIAGLSDSLTAGPIDKARHTAKHMSAALGALAAFTYLIVLGRYHGPGGGFIAFLWVVSAAAYWVLLPWWVYLDAKWRRMDAMPWAVLTLVTNVFGLVTYLVIRYPDPRVCPHCRAYLTVGLKRCPYCGSEAEPTCPRCQAPIKTDWVFCPSCAAQLPSVRPTSVEEQPKVAMAIHGCVTDAVSGLPLSGVEVGTDAKADRVTTHTDASGRFTLTDLQPRPHVILSSADGYVSEAKAFTPGDEAQMNFALYPRKDS